MQSLYNSKRRSARGSVGGIENVKLAYCTGVYTLLFENKSAGQFCLWMQYFFEKLTTCQRTETNFWGYHTSRTLCRTEQIVAFLNQHRFLITCLEWPITGATPWFMQVRVPDQYLWRVNVYHSMVDLYCLNQHNWLYSDCLRRESNFLASMPWVTALCMRVCCIACV